MTNNGREGTGREWMAGARRLLVIAVLALACAASPRPRPEAASRVKDSAPDKIAAQRAASGNLRLEDEDQRWGIDAARERRDQATQRKQAPTPVPLSPPTGPVDLQSQAPLVPAPAPPGGSTK